jgi:hypothetical protein
VFKEHARTQYRGDRGLSWGGAILAELLVQGQVGYHVMQPAALFDCPFAGVGS